MRGSPPRSPSSLRLTRENIARLDSVPNPDVFRDGVNKWIEATLGTCLQKYNENPTEINREFLFLYRLLTVMYRIKHPLRGKSYNPDVDLKLYLEHKVCSTLHK